jgi:hypothetical protein
MVREFLPWFVLSLLAAPCLAQEKPSRESTKEERDRVLEIVSRVERDPLNAEAKKDQRWAVKFLAEASDIQVMISDVVIALMEKVPEKNEYRSLLFGQYLIASGADVIRNEGKSDEVRTSTYALKSCLSVYKTLTKDHPERKIEGLEELIKKNDQELKAFVQENLKKGKKGKE